jgi:hypothetical protein
MKFKLEDELWASVFNVEKKTPTKISVATKATLWIAFVICVIFTTFKIYSNF